MLLIYVVYVGVGLKRIMSSRDGVEQPVHAFDACSNAREVD